MITPPEWPWIARLYLNSPFSSFTDFKPCLHASKIKAMEPILVCKFFFKLSSESSFQYRKYNIPTHRSICFSFVLVMVEPYLWHIWRCEYQRNPFCISGIQELQSEFSPLWGDLSFCVNGLWRRMYWRGIAAAAAAAFRGDRGYRYRGGNGFPMHAWRFNLRFNICSNLVDLARDLPRQVWKIRNTQYWGFLPSCATRNCSSQCQSCDYEFHSPIFRDHDLSKSIRSILGNSVMVLVLQCQEHQ